MRQWILAAALAAMAHCAWAAPAAAGPATTISAAKRADILELIHTTGALDVGMRIGKALSGHLIQLLSRMHPGISKQAVRDIQQACVDIVARPATQARFEDAAVTLYAHYYSDADIRGMIRFYQTPLGKKIIRVTPELSQRALLAGENVVKPLRGELIDLINQYLERDHIDPRTLQPEQAAAKRQGRETAAPVTAPEGAGGL